MGLAYNSCDVEEPLPSRAAAIEHSPPKRSQCDNRFNYCPSAVSRCPASVGTARPAAWSAWSAWSRLRTCPGRRPTRTTRHRRPSPAEALVNRPSPTCRRRRAPPPRQRPGAGRSRMAARDQLAVHTRRVAACPDIPGPRGRAPPARSKPVRSVIAASVTMGLSSSMVTAASSIGRSRSIHVYCMASVSGSCPGCAELSRCVSHGQD